MKQSKKRRRNHPGKLMAKSRSQPVNLLGAGPLMSPLVGLIAGQSLYFCLTAALWCFVDIYAQRADARKALQQDKTWINSYIKKMLKMLVKQVHLSLRFKKKNFFLFIKTKWRKVFFHIHVSSSCTWSLRLNIISNQPGTCIQTINALQPSCIFIFLHKN